MTEMEHKQEEIIQQLVTEASDSNASSSLATLIAHATSHPSLFAFSEILSLPNVIQVLNLPFMLDRILYLLLFTCFNVILFGVICYLLIL